MNLQLIVFSHPSAIHQWTIGAILWPDLSDHNDRVGRTLLHQSLIIPMLATIQRRCLFYHTNFCEVGNNVCTYYNESAPCLSHPCVAAIHSALYNTLIYLTIKMKFVISSISSSSICYSASFLKNITERCGLLVNV